MANFIVEFPLKTEKYQEDILNKRFEIGRHIYNSLVNVTQKRYKEMIKTKKYRTLLSSLTGNKKSDKEIWKQRNDIRKQYGMSEYSFHEDVKQMQKYFKSNMDSFTAQKIATKLWKSYDKLFYGNGKKVYYKKYGEFHSLEGKSNTTGIRLKDDRITWNGLKIPVVIDHDNDYENQAMQSKICYNRIVRKYVRNKYKYYVQIVFQGNPPIKVDTDTGERKHDIGKGDIGIDIGTRTVALSSKSDVYIISLGHKVYVEKMNFAGLQKRAKNTEKNDKGKFKKKKRFGKSLANKAPSMLLTIIDRKLGYYGERLIEINTFKAKASQFNHFDRTYTKKTLSQRWDDFNGIRIQRDLYSAFLIMNISDDLKNFNMDKCKERFENFYRLHNIEVGRLTGKKNLSSIAI